MAKTLLPKEEWLKQQQARKKANTCAFNNYNDVTDDMVDRFWNRYKSKLVDEEDIRNGWDKAYDIAKMLYPNATITKK